MSVEAKVTSEEVAPGALPSWLWDHMLAQCRDPRPYSNGGPARILVIYSSDEARRECLERLADEGVVIDRTLHHTLESLETSLLADLRLPRALSISGAWQVVLNEECSRAARRLEFPILNPIETMEWNIHRTRALASLHSVLAREGKLAEFEGPGIDSFSRIIRRLETRIGGTHPDFVTSRVVSGLLESDNPPFGLREVDGIILANHAPMMGQLRRELVLAIAKHRPVHQLEYPGNFRLGIHGEHILDEQFVRSPNDLPDWVPAHVPLAQNAEWEECGQQVRARVQREEHSIGHAIDEVDSFLAKKTDAEIIIIDPNLSENQQRWKRNLSHLGVPIGAVESMAVTQPIGHWLRAVSGICHGPNSFSLEALRALGVQDSVELFDPPASHPSDSRITPEIDADMLTQLARNEHVLGGVGALYRWLETLAREPILDGSVRAERDARAKESCQWFVLCLAESNRALLNHTEKKLLDDLEVWRGCFTGESLPRPARTESGDDWLAAILARADLDMTAADGGKAVPAAVVQALVDALNRLRRMQESAKHTPPKGGRDWVEEFDQLLISTAVPHGGSKYRSNVRLLTPEAALGCTADLIVIANSSSLSWNLSVPRYAFLGEEDRHELDILRPDTPIRRARHHLNHLLCAARRRLVIIDPSLDDATPAAAPIREWATRMDPANSLEPLVSGQHSKQDPRRVRRNDGDSLSDMQAPSRSPLNPLAVTIPLDVKMQRDLENRQPVTGNTEDYLPEEARPFLTYLKKDSLLTKPPTNKVTPRAAKSWPTLGAKYNATKSTTTLDPRPFLPESTDCEPFDSRHGRLENFKLEIPRWSASRLKDWQTCPRLGWTKHVLGAQEEEEQEEDVDPRTHGELLHEVHHHLLAHELGMVEGRERTIEEIRSGDHPVNIARSRKSDEELQARALIELDVLAPWLDRSDAVSTSRLRMLTGMSNREWNDWLVKQDSTPAAGRVGTIVRSERALRDSIPVAFEWNTFDFDAAGIEIDLSANLTSPSKQNLDPIRLSGYIDRVDLLPFSDNPLDLVDESGSDSVAPMRIRGTDWRPKRLVIIRDLKTTESKTGEERHEIGMLEEVQLALYSRAWEIAHPGDLVVAAGISSMGHFTDHIIEMSGHLPSGSLNLQFGERSELTSSRHRFPDEGPNPPSDPFRAWLAHRLSTALGVADGAARGIVNPTPSEVSCRFCPVKSLCPVSVEEAF